MEEDRFIMLVELAHALVIVDGCIKSFEKFFLLFLIDDNSTVSTLEPSKPILVVLSSVSSGLGDGHGDRFRLSLDIVLQRLVCLFSFDY